MTLLPITVIAFVITNIDDFLMLNILFGGPYRRSHIIIGQFSGISILIALSIIGATISTAWIHNKSIIGLLGFIPIVLGILALRHSNTSDAGMTFDKGKKGVWQAVTVAVLTIGSGYDNLGVYIPLFASVNTIDIGIMTCVFLVLTGVWCILASRFVRALEYAGKTHFDIHNVTERLSRAFPWVLISLGAYVLLVNESIPMLIQKIPVWILN